MTSTAAKKAPLATDAASYLIGAPNQGPRSTRSDDMLGISAELTSRSATQYTEQRQSAAASTVTSSLAKESGWTLSGSVEPNFSFAATPSVKAVDWPRATTFSAVQEWEGYVVGVNDGFLIAHLIDLTADAHRAGEEAQIASLRKRLAELESKVAKSGSARTK
jgi:hypothetical protein